MFIFLNINLSLNHIGVKLACKGQSMETENVPFISSCPLYTG